MDKFKITSIWLHHSADFGHGLMSHLIRSLSHHKKAKRPDPSSAKYNLMTTIPRCIMGTSYCWCGKSCLFWWEGLVLLLVWGR